MADTELIDALGGLDYAPVETGWGIGAQSIAQALPSLTNPYASPISNLGVTLGGALVASLLGYQARKEAFDMGLQTQRYANQLMRLETPEARTSFLEALPSDVAGTAISGRLGRLSTALGRQQALQNALIGQKVAEQEALAKFQLGDAGTKLYERDLDKALQVARAQRGGEGVDKDAAKEDRKILRYAQSAETIAKEFDKLNMSAAEFEIQRRIPGSKAELVYSNLLGNLTNFARLGGQGAQVSDQDRNDQFNSLFGPEVPFIGRISGTSDIANRIREKIKAAPLSTGVLGSTMQETSTDTTESEAQKRNRELKARLAKLEALAAQRK